MTRQQFIALVEQSRKSLRRFLAALCCGDCALADDIAQETYMKAYVSLDMLKDPDKAINWLYRIAYNTFINHTRSARYHVSTDTLTNLPAKDNADKAFEYDNLYKALESLSANERTAILLFYLEDYTLKEIAKTLNISTDAAKQHLSRGRRHLRLIIENQQ